SYSLVAPLYLRCSSIGPCLTSWNRGGFNSHREKHTMSKSKPITEQTSSKAINAKITAVRKAETAFNNAVHEAAMMIMEHAKAYNDCSGAVRLFDAMQKSNRRSLLVKWIEMFSPIVLEKKDGKGHSHFAKEGSKRAIKFNLEGARETPWYA